MKRPAPLILSLMVLGVLLLSSPSTSQPIRSVELGIAEHSTRGITGGMVVPASYESIWCPLGYADNGEGVCVAHGYCGGYYYWNGSSCQDCYVDDGVTQYQTLSCPPGQTGGIYQSRTSYCANPADGPLWPAWTTYSNTCVPIANPPTVTITPPGGTPASTANVITGQTATITWSCPSPNTSSSGVNFSTGGAASGSTGVVVSTNTTYTVVCDQTSTQASVTAVAINASMSLAASPSRVSSGATSVLTWSASGVISCSLAGPGTTDAATAVSGSISSRNKTTAAVTGQSIYTLTCQTEATPISTSVNVSLIPIQIEI